MPQSPLETAFLKRLQAVDGVKRWVIGLSGGLDSMVLLALAAKTLPQSHLLVLHVDHQLQIHSAKWSDFCRQQARAFGLPFQSVQVTVDSGASLERAARDARYHAFAECLQGDDCLLLAHHAGDQAETLLFRLLRGAGVRGLAGMPEQRDLGRGRLLRPLLGMSKQQLLVWAEQEALSWVEDPSNQDEAFDRNYLRQQVMPRLERRWPGFARRWGQTAAHLAQADRLLAELAQIDRAAVEGDYGRLELDALAQLSTERQDNLLRYWLWDSTGHWISQRQLTNLRRTLIAAVGDSAPQVQLHNVVLRRYRGQLYLHNPGGEPPDWQRQALVEQGVVTPVGRLVVCRSVSGEGLKQLNGLQLRNRRDGDRCRPAGRGGSCSLKKLFQEAGVPPWLRDEWPIVVVGDEIVAVPGICVCEGWQAVKNIPAFALQWQPSALFDCRDSGTL